MASCDAVLCLLVISRDTFFSTKLPSLNFYIKFRLIGSVCYLFLLYKDWFIMPNMSEMGAKIHTLLHIKKHMGCLMMLCFGKWANLTSSGKWTGKKSQGRPGRCKGRKKGNILWLYMADVIHVKSIATSACHNNIQKKEEMWQTIAQTERTTLVENHQLVQSACFFCKTGLAFKNADL